MAFALASVLSALGMVACGTPKPPTQPIACQQDDAATAQFASDTDAVQSFAGRADALIQECELLQNHPGWEDLAHILRANASIEYVEGADVAKRKNASQLAGWSRRWHTSAQVILDHYNALVTKSASLDEEEQRLRATAEVHRESWKRAKTACLFVLSSSDPTTATAVVESLETVKRRVDNAYAPLLASLVRYELDEMGLYRARSR
jgi:hypothetical protein